MATGFWSDIGKILEGDPTALVGVPVTEPEARGAYVGMQGRRSIARLHQLFTERGRKVPSVRTFKEWSATHKWTACARDYDARVSKAADELMADAAVERVLNVSQMLNAASSEAAEKLLQGVRALDATSLTPSGLRALAEVIERAAKMHELLEGRPTDRTEHVTKKRITDQLEEMEREIEEQMRRVKQAGTVH